MDVVLESSIAIIVKELNARGLKTEWSQESEYIYFRRSSDLIHMTLKGPIVWSKTVDKLLNKIQKFMIECEIRTELRLHMKNITELKIKISNAQSIFNPILDQEALRIEEAKCTALNKELENFR